MDDLINTRAAARLLGVAPETMVGWRYRGTGPRYYRFGPRTVRYARADVLAYAAAGVVEPGEDLQEAAEAP